MLNIARLSLVGNVTEEPEVRRVDDNGSTVVATFSVAVNHENNKTSFFTVVATKRLAETVINDIQKGSFISCEGILEQRKWEGRDGSPKRDYFLILDFFRHYTRSDSFSRTPWDLDAVQS